MERRGVTGGVEGKDSGADSEERGRSNGRGVQRSDFDINSL